MNPPSRSASRARLGRELRKYRTDAGLLIAGTETAAVPGVEATRVIAWTFTERTGRWRREIVRALGSDPDPLSAVTGVAVFGRDRFIGARLGDRLRLAVSRDGGVWQQLPIPGTRPAGSRARIELRLAPDGESLYIALTGDATPRLLEMGRRS